MSDRLPALRPREVIRALERVGWRIVRQRGSHVSLHKAGYPNVVTVPLNNRDISRGTLQGIINDAELSTEEFLDLI